MTFLPISKLGVAAAILYLIPVGVLYLMSVFSEDRYQFAEALYTYFSLILTFPWSFGVMTLLDYLGMYPDGLWWDDVISTFSIFFGAILNALIIYFTVVFSWELAKKLARKIVEKDM